MFWLGPVGAGPLVYCVSVYWYLCLLCWGCVVSMGQSALCGCLEWLSGCVLVGGLVPSIAVVGVLLVVGAV